MKALILCAKKKENLFPFTETTPTGLIPIAGKPAVRHIVEDLRAVGTEEIYLVTNHLEERFEDEFKNEEDISIVHQEEVTGTADAVKHCDFIEDDFFVVNGDVMVSRDDLRDLKKKHLNERPEATVLGDNEDRPEKFGVLSIVNDEVKTVEEKPEQAENSLVNTGVYAFRTSIFQAIEDSSSSSLAEAVGELARRRKVKMSVIDDYWMEIDSLRKVWKADRFKRDKAVSGQEIAESAQVHELAEIKGNVRIGENAVIRENTTVEGPVIVGENSVLGPNGSVFNSTVGANCQIRGASVENSFLFDNQVIDPHAHVEQSVLGRGTNIKAGTVIYESFIGDESFIEMNNSVKGATFYPDARTDLGEITK
ncbi:sugar phosphate nucleotidyltransferase [Candidatus Nanohalococcus occultus]|uniref:sugar phosphate nucleotidyltransferase n=1 Tax=Candidatus Nanohalococcus occultus TaxID=2978047 RepID=UPI0039E0C22B